MVYGTEEGCGCGCGRKEVAGDLLWAESVGRGGGIFVAKGVGGVGMFRVSGSSSGGVARKVAEGDVPASRRVGLPTAGIRTGGVGLRGGGW